MSKFETPVADDRTQNSSQNTEPSKLCIDAIGDAWAKKNNSTTERYAKGIEGHLNMRGASKEAVNDRFVDELLKGEIQRYGEEKGRQRMQKAESVLNCH